MADAILDFGQAREALLKGKAIINVDTYKPDAQTGKHDAWVKIVDTGAGKAICQCSRHGAVNAVSFSSQEILEGKFQVVTP